MALDSLTAKANTGAGTDALAGQATAAAAAMAVARIQQARDADDDDAAFLLLAA